MDCNKNVFHHMVLIFHSFKGFSDLEDIWDDLPVSRLKYNALDDFEEVFQTTDDFQEVVLRILLPCFSDLKDFWDDLPVSRLKYKTLDDFQEVFKTTSRKSSRRLPRSVLTKSSSISNGVQDVIYVLTMCLHIYKSMK
ncbi:hypothetical protein F2Q69_00036796 [Brassica cretica]|uniref:Uncharacterized protein n=1 Tax=Brassica cretica TaxID=69181 RepID=A0A8S9SBR2_BRACR|nr:hypothetical protein F2Q69_00036796 [Brassica cretica]